MQVQRLQGYFNGTGAAVYLCVGQIPNAVKLIDIENSTNSNFIEWNRAMFGSFTAYGGILMTGSTGVYTKLTTTGVFPYEGGEVLTSAMQTSVGYGQGVYLGWDTKDYRADASYGPISGSGTPINRWTLDTSANRTGHFNTDLVASNSRIAVGSIIRVKEDLSGQVKEAAITALTSSATSTTDYVTLSRALKAGAVTYIGGQYRLAPLALGAVTPAGLYVADTTVNVNNDTISFEMDIDIG